MRKSSSSDNLPELWGVLYVAAHPDNQSHWCRNCMMYEADKQRCEIHDKNLRVLPNMVCGYWVGKGFPVKPQYSGLETVGAQGAWCQNCEYYDATTSRCQATVNEQGQHPRVDAKGCCARWEKEEEKNEDKGRGAIVSRQ